MTRIELCCKLTECRKDSGVKMKDICFSMNVMPTVIYRLESGNNSFTLQNLLSYLNSIRHSLYIDGSVINGKSDIANLLKEEREHQHLSLRKFSSQSNLPLSTIKAIESVDKNLYIDSFLAYANYIGCTIEILPK